MRLELVVMAALLGTIGCQGGDPETHTGESFGDTGATEEIWPSDFTAARFRMSSFVLLSEDGGDDLDGDEEPDNSLPNALFLANAFVPDDISRDGINFQVEEAIAADDLVILLTAAYEGGALAADILAGVADEETGALSVDMESSYEGGEPKSHLEGVFSDQTTFESISDAIVVPVTFYPEEPPLPVPLVDARMYGTLEISSSSGRIVGIVPAEALIDQVIDPLIPEEGYGDRTKEELMELIRSLAENEHVADQELPDGSRGVSAAFSYAAGVAEFELPE